MLLLGYSLMTINICFEYTNYVICVMLTNYDTCVNKNVKDYDKVINFLLLIFQPEQCNFF